MGIFDFLKSKGSNVESKINAPDNKDNYDYMQLRLSYSLENIQEIFNKIIEKRNNISIPSYIEIRQAKSKNVYPYWLVFYVQTPEDFDQLVRDIGNGNIEGGRQIYHGTDYDDGFGKEKYESIKQGSILLKSESLK